MDDHLFVSYSSVDGSEFVLRLVDPLTAGPPPFSVWFDRRQLRPGEAWDRQLVEAIRECRAVLFVMTPDSVLDSSVCKREWVRALKYKKPVIPLLVHPEAELPFQLEPRQYVDFTVSFEEGLARLREHLVWMDSPQGVLQALVERMEDAERELPRARDPAQQARTEREINELRRQIAEQRRLLADPKAESERTQQRIASGLEREREPERPVVSRRAKFVNPPPVTAPTWFQDRHVETKMVGDFLKDPSLRLLTVVGRGGVGKTAMICRLLKALEGGQLPDDLGPLEVDGIIYLSPVGAHKVSFPNLFADLTRLLPEETAHRLDRLYQDPQQTTRDQTLALLEAFPGGRTVLLLDNFEDAVDPQTLAVTDDELDEALQTLLSAPGHGVKVILTTRVAPQELLLVQPGLQQRLNLDEGLPSPFAENILRAMDRDGTLGLKTAPDTQLAEARERTRGYPRALEALVAILAADRNTSLPELLAETDQLLPRNVVEALVGEAFNRLDPLAQQVMQALAIYGLPVPPVAVDYLLQPYLLAVDSAPVLGRLVNMQFVRRDAGRYYLHQVDRDYALSRIPPGQPTDRDALERPFTRYALLARGAEYFEQTRTPRESWTKLDDLAAQLAEFELRYQGEDYDNAASVLHQIDFDYLLLWGHYRLMVELHERLHGKLLDPNLEHESMGNIGSALLRMGRYPRAIQCYDEALELARMLNHRQGEGAWLGNLGVCYAELGELRRAIDHHEQALAIAQEIGDRQGEANQLGNLGNCYIRLGEPQRAIDHLERGLAIAREIGDRLNEGSWLGNLGVCYAGLGELRRAIDHHEQALAIAREIGDRQNEAYQLGNLGNCYIRLGEVHRAIDQYEQGLAIAREIGDRQNEAYQLGNLGVCHADLGELRRAIDYHEQALAIAREIGQREGEANQLGNLGIRYGSLGEVWRAIDFHEQALAIAREIGHREGEAIHLGNLGICHYSLGELRRAIDYLEQALAITREIGDRQSEAMCLVSLADCDAHGELWDQAIQRYDQAIRIADEIGLVQGQSDGRSGLARVHLFQGALASAREAAEAARSHDYAPNTADLSAVLGVVLLREGASERARVAFSEAVVQADALLEQTSDNYRALDTKALALCGLALLGDVARLPKALAAMRAARAITRAPGVVRNALRLFDAVAVADQDGTLDPVRAVATSPPASHTDQVAEDRR